MHFSSSDAMELLVNRTPNLEFRTKDKRAHSKDVVVVCGHQHVQRHYRTSCGPTRGNEDPLRGAFIQRLQIQSPRDSFDVKRYKGEEGNLSKGCRWRQP